MPERSEREEDLLDMLNDLEVPLRPDITQQEIRSYLTTHFRESQIGLNPTHAQLQALQRAVQIARGEAKKLDITQVIRRLSPTRTDIRWIIPQMRGLFGTRSVTKRIQAALSQ